MINGITSVALTKWMCLASFEKINVCVGYESLIGNKIIKSFPTNVEYLSNVTPIYETLDGWNTDITNCERYDDLAKTN